MTQLAFKQSVVKHNTTEIKGITDVSVSGGIQQEMLQGGGSIDPHNAITVVSAPKISFNTTDLVVFLGICGINGVAITGSALFRFYYRKLSNAGQYAAGGADVLSTVNQGVMFYNTINAPLNKVATISASVIPTFDGTNLPIVQDVAATAPTLGRDIVGFVGGPVSIGGTAVPAMGWTFELNSNWVTEGSDGLPYPTEVFHISRNPKLVIPILNTSLLATLGPLEGVANATVIFYLRKQSVGGGYVADATAEHIKYTITVGSAYLENYNSTSSGVNTQNLCIIPVYDGTNAIVIQNLASAIT